MGSMLISRATSTLTAIAALAVAVGLSACSSVGAASSATTAASSPNAAGAASGTTGSASTSAGAKSAAAGAAAIVPQASKLDWKPCTGQLSGLQCASLQVPLNYADPGGRKITIALSMIPATAPAAKQQGVMFVNPGGPGEPGRSLAAAVAQGISPQVAATYDIVGFDPRGVGGSSPSLS